MNHQFPTSSNYPSVHGVKPFVVSKGTYFRLKPPKASKQCNAFTAHGSIATRCPDYMTRTSELNAVVQILNYKPPQMRMTTIELNPERPWPSFLFRNVKRGRINDKIVEKQRQLYLQRREVESTMVVTENFAKDAAFRHHLVTFHDNEEAEDMVVETTPRRRRHPESSDRQLRSAKQTPKMNRVSFEQSKNTRDLALPSPCNFNSTQDTMYHNAVAVYSPEKENNQDIVFCRVDGTGPLVRREKIKSYNSTLRSRNPFESTHLHEMNDDLDAINDVLNRSILSDFGDISTRDGLMRSFYTIYHRRNAPPDPPEYRDVLQARRQFAYSEIVSNAISKPPIDGLKFREYNDTEYESLYPFTKEVLSLWRACLSPALLPPGDYAESGGEEPSEALRIWNWCVRQGRKRKSLLRNSRQNTLNQTMNSTNSGIVEHPEDGVQTTTARQFYEGSDGEVVMEEVTERIIERRTRRIKKKSFAISG